MQEGSPHIVDSMGEGRIQLVVNTPESSDGLISPARTIGALLDSRSIRLVAHEMGIPTFTTMAAALAGAHAIASLKKGEVLRVQALQDYHRRIAQPQRASGASGACSKVVASPSAC